MGTAGNPTAIEGIGTVKVNIGGRSVRFGKVLYVPALEGNLVSTHELHSRGIGNMHLSGEYKFVDSKGRIVAKGKTVD